MAINTITLEALRQRLLDTAELARDTRIDHKDDAFVEARAEVEQILVLFRELYKQDPSRFTESLLGDIRISKICAGIITREDLSWVADERAAEAYERELAANHQTYLASKRIPYKGMHVAERRHRQTHCYCGRAWLDNRVHMECNGCGGIICYACGGCLCGQS